MKKLAKVWETKHQESLVDQGQNWNID